MTLRIITKAVLAQARIGESAYAMILILIYFVTRAWAQPAVLEENSINGLTGGAGMILTGSITHEEKPYEYHSNIMSPNHYLVNHLDFHMVADDCDLGQSSSRYSESSDQSCSQDSNVASQRRQLQNSIPDLGLIPGGGNLEPEEPSVKPNICNC